MTKNFRILEGKSLKSAIQSAGKAIATFSQLQHELAYGAILHLENHNDATYVQAVYDMMPANYKGTVRVWFTAFGKCKFDAESKSFTYEKGKKSDLPSALATSPAEYQKESKGKAETAFDEIAYLGKVLKKLQDESADPRAISAIEGAIRLLKMPVLVVETAPKAKKAKAESAQPEAVAA